MEKIMTTCLAISVSFFGLSQAKFTADGKTVSTVKHGVKNLKVEVPVDPSAKKYDRLAVVIHVKSESGFAGTQQMVLNGGGVQRTLRDQSAQGTYYRHFEDNFSSVSILGGSIVKSDGSSSFISWLPKIDGLSVGMDHHNLKMNEIDSHPLRVDKKYKITAELWGANAEKKWDQAEEKYYNYYDYKTVKKFSEVLVYEFSVGKTDHFAKDKSYSVLKIANGSFGNPNCQSLKFEKESSPITKVNYQQNYFTKTQESGGLEIINWSIYDSGTEYQFNYDFVSFPASSMSFEDTKTDLYNFLYVLANPKSSASSGFGGGSLLGKGIGTIKSKLNKDKSIDGDDSVDKKVEGGPTNVYWNKYLDCFYVIPGLCENLKSGFKANDKIMSAHPEVPTWEKVEINGLEEAYVLRTTTAVKYGKGYKYDLSSKKYFFDDNCEKEMYQFQFFIGKKDGKVYAGACASKKQDESTNQKNAKLAQELTKTFKAF